jgi:hypothetical protein
MNSKNKGSKFERDFAKYLTKWFSGQDKDLYFWRTPSSGALHTITQFNQNISGDIVALKPEAAWVTDNINFELKHGYPKLDFYGLLSIKNHKIESFWKQCCKSAGDKIPILIIRRNNSKIILGTIINIVNMLPRIKIDLDELSSCIFYDCDMFFNNIKSKDLREILCQYTKK